MSNKSKQKEQKCAYAHRTSSSRYNELRPLSSIGTSPFSVLKYFATFILNAINLISIRSSKFPVCGGWLCVRKTSDSGTLPNGFYYALPVQGSAMRVDMDSQELSNQYERRIPSPCLCPSRFNRG